MKYQFFFAVAAIAACSLVACASDDTADKAASGSPAVLTLQIDKSKIDPQNSIFSVKFDAVTSIVQQFSLVNAVSINGAAIGATSLRLFYFWYWDLEPNGSVTSAYAVCNDDPICAVEPCAKAAKVNNTHTMLAIVATDRLKSAAKDVFDFADGAKFEFVQWQVEIKGKCPTGP